MTPRTVRLSKRLAREVEQTGSNRVVVAAIIPVMAREVDEFRQLGLFLDEGTIRANSPAPPPASSGLYARRNLDGWSVKRTDLPKETRDLSTWAPSWNNSGYHLVSRDIEAYPLEYHPAKLLTVSATVLEELVGGALVRFRVDQPLDRDAEGFAADLRFNLRLLREAVGTASVFAADLSDEEFARIQQIDWELLPAGSGDRVLAHLASRPGDRARLSVAAQRLRVLDSLGHDGYILGHGSFARYFGVKFGERLVALESLEYGNALYVFEEDWKKLSQLSRTEIIRRRDPAVHRIPHVPGWQSAVRKLLRGQANQTIPPPIRTCAK